MTFPNANRGTAVAFWVVVLVGLALFGMTAARVTELGTSPHPVLAFIQHLSESDLGLYGWVLGIGASIAIGYVVFGAWATLTFLVFWGLTRLDRDLTTHMRILVDPGMEWESDLRGLEVSDLLIKTMLFAVVSGALAAFLLSFLI